MVSSPGQRFGGTTTIATAQLTKAMYTEEEVRWEFGGDGGIVGCPS